MRIYYHYRKNFIGRLIYTGYKAIVHNDRMFATVYDKKRNVYCKIEPKFLDSLNWKLKSDVKDKIL